MTGSDKSNKGVHTSPEPLNDNKNSLSAAEGDITHDEKDLTIKQNNQRVYSSNHDSSSPVMVSSDLSDTTLEDLYKMRAHGRKGHREPTRIEFDLMKGRGRIRKNKFGFQLDQRRCVRLEPTNCTCKNNKEVPNLTNESSWNKLQNVFTAKPNVDKKEENVINVEKIKPNIVEAAKKIEEKNKKKKVDESGCPNMEIYYFDHGNSAYFRTTDCPPNIASEIIAQQTTYHATKFWAEIFGAFHVGIAFFVAFILQTFRFILYSTVRPIIVGFLQMTSDYFVKPTITILFNGLLQPPLILLYNIFSSICDMLEPVAKTIGHFLRPIGEILKSIRLVEIHYHRKETEIV